MAGRPIIAFVSLVLLAAAVLFQFFVVLSGAVNHTPINKFYYLVADTNGMGGARNMGSVPMQSAWTFFSLCQARSVSGSTSTFGCRPAKAAQPFDPPRNFGDDVGVPSPFLGTSKYFLMSRFTFAFYLIAIFFAGIALLTGLLALCTRLASYLSGAMTFVALGFQGLATALMTAFVIQGRDAFRRNGNPAAVGRFTMGFSWASVACLFIATVLFCVGGAAGKDKGYKPKKSRFGAFGRKRSTRSRGSFGETDNSGLDNGRVKDEYA